MPSSAEDSTDFAGASGTALDTPADPSSGAGLAVLPVGSSSSNPAVPEPGSMALLAAAGLAAWCWRLGRRRAAGV
jgi:hypothetical protein